jgi:hypothetical protein
MLPWPVGQNKVSAPQSTVSSADAGRDALADRASIAVMSRYRTTQTHTTLTAHTDFPTERLTTMPRVFDADVSIEELRLRYRLDEVERELVRHRIHQAAEASLASAKMVVDALEAFDKKISTSE